MRKVFATPLRPTRTTLTGVAADSESSAIESCAFCVRVFRAFRPEIISHFLGRSRDGRDDGDETSWLVLPKNILTPQGGGTEKDRITVDASVAADWTELRLLFVAQSKTVRIEDTPIGTIDGHSRIDTENGWQTEESFLFYLPGGLRLFDLRSLPGAYDTTGPKRE
jgi:hypothetical protein